MDALPVSPRRSTLRARCEGTVGDQARYVDTGAADKPAIGGACGDPGIWLPDETLARVGLAAHLEVAPDLRRISLTETRSNLAGEGSWPALISLAPTLFGTPRSSDFAEQVTNDQSHYRSGQRLLLHEIC
jgi:hypothetical protein